MGGCLFLFRLVFSWRRWSRLLLLISVTKKQGMRKSRKPESWKIQEKLRKTDFRNPKKSIFVRIVFSTFWWSPRVVGGWNFDSAYLSTSRTCQGARTTTKIEFFRRISTKTSKKIQKKIKKNFRDRLYLLIYDVVTY